MTDRVADKLGEFGVPVYSRLFGGIPSQRSAAVYPSLRVNITCRVFQKKLHKVYAPQPYVIESCGFQQNVQKEIVYMHDKGQCLNTASKYSLFFFSRKVGYFKTKLTAKSLRKICDIIYKVRTKPTFHRPAGNLEIIIIIIIRLGELGLSVSK